MGTHVSVELDDYAHQAYREFCEASNTINEARQRKDKAHDALVTFLRLNDANMATDGDVPVIRLVEFDRTTLDAPRLKTEEPFIYRRFARIAHAEYLRLVDGPS